MMGWTDRHERYFLRMISRRILLYTEMLSPEAVLFGRRDLLLAFDPEEHPVALQLGGHDPAQMAAAARIAESWGYDEINMNVGCPSERGQDRRFGACLMAEPETVAACVRAMQEAVRVPVTVKTRIGIDRDDGYEPLGEFVARIAAAGCRVFVVHARKAWLDGLSPRENRAVPPLRYDYVYRLKRDFPQLTIVLNGGIEDWGAAREPLERLDGIMIGRKAYEDPYWLSTVDSELFQENSPRPGRAELLERYLPYVERQLARGEPLLAMARHLMRLYQGVPRARAWRRHITEACPRAGAGVEVLRTALQIAEIGARQELLVAK
ncbi:MAG: tRNA dihydrouridine(20/20a) synthase DusA [Armatimonadetes bacterium]|nr:tRNA dihydrouridine(20/20a) synthase DusA [Armatimonadota bacterium]